MHRYPDHTTANIEDFRRSNWQAAIVRSDGLRVDVWEAFSAAARLATEGGRFPEAKVLWLIADACSMFFDRKGSGNKPFKPLMVTSTGRSPIPEDFKITDIDLLAQISEEVDEPWIQGRLADLVWLLKQPRSPKYALLAIDAYRKIPLHFCTSQDGRDCWERAITLSRLLRTGAGQRVNEIEVAILAAFKGARKADDLLSLRLARLLFSNGLGKSEGLYIGNKLESLGQLLKQEGDFPKVRSFFQAAAQWFKLADEQDKGINATVEFAEGWVKEAGARMASPSGPGSAVAAGFYENAIQTYRTTHRFTCQRMDA